MNCPSCNYSGSFIFELVNSRNNLIRNSRIYKCENCKLYFKDVNECKELIKDFYLQNNTDYSERINSEYRPTQAFLFSEILRYVPGRRVIDIGCNDASFLSFFDDEFELCGVEPSSVSFVDSRVQRYSDFFEDIDFGNLKFDIVTSFDVIEHLTDVHSFFAKLSLVSNSGNRIYLTTPDTDSLTFSIFGRYWRHFVPVEHILFFNDQSIKLFAERHGLEFVDSVCFNHKRGFLKSFYRFLRSLITFPFKLLLKKVLRKEVKLYIEMFYDYKLFILTKK